MRTTGGCVSTVTRSAASTFDANPSTAPCQAASVAAQPTTYAGLMPCAGIGTLTRCRTNRFENAEPKWRCGSRAKDGETPVRHMVRERAGVNSPADKQLITRQREVIRERYRRIGRRCHRLAGQCRRRLRASRARENLARLRASTNVVMIEPVPHHVVRGIGFYRQFFSSRDWADFMRAGHREARRVLATAPAAGS